jgi:ribosomal protein S18 acetylase RimI-like enzyme
MRRTSVLPAHIRRAQPHDIRAIYNLVLYAQRRVMLVEWEELRGALQPPSQANTPDTASLASHRMDLLCGEADGQVISFWASRVGPEGIAHLQALIVHDEWPERPNATALLNGVKQALRDGGRVQLAYVGLEPWLTEVLVENGFTRCGSVIALQKVDGAIPDRGNSGVYVRQAKASDLPAILAVDTRAFVPLWRTDPSTLADRLAHSPFFRVGELGQRIVAYAYASLVGRHGHLTRLVVDPSVQGQRIGIRLLAECIDFFGRQGVYGITLNTQDDNHRARHLYRRFGFVPMGQEAGVWCCSL